MTDFDPASAPRIEHAIVDEETQTQRYLAEIAMEDLRLLPDPSARRVRPGSLLDKYKKDVAAQHAQEAQNDRAEVSGIDEVVLEEVSRTSVPSVPPPGETNKMVREFSGPDDASGD
jgi:hypothetical protein